MSINGIKGKVVAGVAFVAAACIISGAIVVALDKAKPAPPKETVQGYLGGEKVSLFEDPAFKQAASDAGLDVEYKKTGSLDMMTAGMDGIDYLFPSSQAAVEYGKQKGIDASDSDIVLNSPIVLYTYKDVADALVGSGIMARDGDSYRLDAAKAVDAMLQDKTWGDLGWSQGYGQFRIDSTDPAKSNSGNEWAALVATVLNGGQPATASSVSRDADKIHHVFSKSGWMESSSEDSFNQFLTLGEGSKPMMVGYESQILDLAANQPDVWKQAKEDVVIAYITPTVWSTHVIIPRDEAGVKLRDLLKTDKVQKLAWEKHGFRGAAFKGTDSISRFGVAGVLDKIPAAVDLPAPDAMEAIIKTVSSK